MLNQDNFYQTLGRLFLALTFFTIAACGQNLTEQQMLDKAKTYLAEDNIKSAALELRNVLQKNTKNTEARFLLGTISLHLGDNASAEKEFNRALLSGGDQQKIQPALARIYLATGRFKKLLDEIKPVDTWTAENQANILGLHALALANLDEIKPALSKLEEAKKVKHDALHVLKTTAIFQLAKLLDGDIEKTITQALSLYPSNNELLFIQASNFTQKEKDAEASAIYQKIIHNERSGLITADVHKASIGLAQLQFQTGKLDLASATLAPILRGNNSSPEANFLSGKINFQQNNNAQALEQIRRVLAAVPDHAPSLLLIGRINYALKEFEQASHYLSLHLKADPNDGAAIVLLTQTYVKLKDAKSALSTLQPILSKNPKEAALLLLRSQIALLTNDFETAITSLESAVKISPNNIALQKQLTKAYISTGQTDLALKNLKSLQAADSDNIEFQKLAISAYLKAGDAKNALKLSKTMLENDPDNPDILTLHASLHAANNNPKKARELFNAARKQQKNMLAATIGLAHLEKKQGNLDEASALYKQLVNEELGGAAPMLALSEIAEKQKNTKSMLSWLKKARTAEPSNIASRLVLANYYLRVAKPDKANIYIQEALKISPKNSELLMLHGRALMSQQRYSEALPTLNDLAKKHPNSVSIQLLVGETSLRLGNAAQARNHINKALKAQPKNIFAVILMSEIEFVSKNYSRSLSFAKQLQRAQPSLSSGYLLEGNVWLARRDFKKANASFAKAWKHQQSAELAKKLFVTAERTSTLDEALKPLQTWLTKQPEDTAIRLFIASIYQSEKQNDKAIQEYEKILEYAPNDSATLNNLAWFYSLKGDPKTLDTAEKAYRSSPENAGIQDTYGWVLTQHGQTEKGLRLLKQAIETLPNNLDVRFHLASALIKSGEKAEGKQILKELLAQDRAFSGKEQAKKLLENTAD